MDVAELGMLLESIDVGAVSQEEFEEAASSSKDLKLEDDQRLLLYGLYKQSIVGDVNVPKPWAIQIVETAKWSVLSMLIERIFKMVFKSNLSRCIGMRGSNLKGFRKQQLKLLMFIS